MKKGTAFLIGLASFSTGVALGILLSPAKCGFGNNNGNTSYHYYGEKLPQDVDNEKACCSGDDPEMDHGCSCSDVFEEDDTEEVGVEVN
jgi:hypothetical protein